MTEFLLYSNRCWVDNDLQSATIHIVNGKIKDVFKAKKTLENIPFYNYGHKIIMPGIIDAHVHINEPGRTHWEGFDSATKAAAFGGVTSLIEMPLNASPVTTNVNAFETKLKATQEKLHVNCGFYGGVIPGNTADIEPLINAGVFGIKGFLIHSGIDEFPNTTKEQLEQIAPILAKHNIPLLLHCELESEEDIPDITDVSSYSQYVSSRPQSWEIKAIEIAIDIQTRFNCSVHIVHLSAADALPIIKERQKKTNKLTVETCVHYLFFNEEEIPNKSPIYKCAPPIRDKANNQKLWTAVKDGTFNLLASDHSPAPPSIKQLDKGDLMNAWGGIAGLQFTLPALLTKQKVNLRKLIPLLTIGPAKFLGLDKTKGKLEKGFDADITIFDDNDTFIVTKEVVQHQHKDSPYLGHKLKGKVTDCIVNGEFVVQNGKLGELNKGKILLKPKN